LALSVATVTTIVTMFTRTSFFRYNVGMKDKAGTIYKRGQTWWVQIHVDGHPVRESSKSTNYADAVKHRDKLIAKKTHGQISRGSPDRVLISELLDDVLDSDIAESTRYVWRLVIEKNIRPFFGSLKAARLTTDKMEEYRKRRTRAGASDATVNRELTILRTSFNNGRKRTPPKVHIVPYFPMVQENNVRQGFLTDEQYTKLRDALPGELRPLFVTGYMVGGRKSELLACEWDWVDFDKGEIAIPAHVTKTDEGKTVPIIPGDMQKLLLKAKQERDLDYPDSRWVFSRTGKRITDFRSGWSIATKAAGVPDLTFHDLRRTAVRNMRRSGVPQVVRMKITGHKTDAMERRYNITDAEDIQIAKKLMAKKRRERYLKSILLVGR
jgi:integrase